MILIMQLILIMVLLLILFNDSTAQDHLLDDLLAMDMDRAVLKIHQRGAQWKQGVVICMLL